MIINTFFGVILAVPALISFLILILVVVQGLTAPAGATQESDLI